MQDDLPVDIWTRIFSFCDYTTSTHIAVAFAFSTKYRKTLRLLEPLNITDLLKVTEETERYRSLTQINHQLLVLAINSTCLFPTGTRNARPPFFSQLQNFVNNFLLITFAALETKSKP
jgi:hypothetical protein